MFSEEKWIFVTNPGNFEHVRLQTNHTGFWPVSGSVPGFGQYLDIDGTPLTDPIPLAYPGSQNDGGVLFIRFPVFFTLPTPYRFYGLHYEFTLPNMPGIQITEGTQLICGMCDSINVPELPSTWLLSMGLVVFGIFRGALRQT